MNLQELFKDDYAGLPEWLGEFLVREGVEPKMFVECREEQGNRWPISYSEALEHKHDIINYAFDWSETSEGRNFWSTLNRKLNKEFS